MAPVRVPRPPPTRETLRQPHAILRSKSTSKRDFDSEQQAAGRYFQNPHTLVSPIFHLSNFHLYIFFPLDIIQKLQQSNSQTADCFELWMPEPRLLIIGLLLVVLLIVLLQILVLLIMLFLLCGSKGFCSLTI